MFPRGRKQVNFMAVEEIWIFEKSEILTWSDPNHGLRSQKVKKLFYVVYYRLIMYCLVGFFSINIFASPFFELPIGVKKIVFTTQIVFIILGTLTPL